jgi:hypothetical protein
VVNPSPLSGSGFGPSTPQPDLCADSNPKCRGGAAHDPALDSAQPPPRAAPSTWGLSVIASTTNALERVNAEIDRRAKVVGIFPNRASLLRLSTAVRQEQHDEWQDGRWHFSQQSMARPNPANQDRLTTPLTAGLPA